MSEPVNDPAKDPVDERADEPAAGRPDDGREPLEGTPPGPKGPPGPAPSAPEVVAPATPERAVPTTSPVANEDATGPAREPEVTAPATGDWVWTHPEAAADGGTLADSEARGQERAQPPAAAPASAPATDLSADWREPASWAGLTLVLLVLGGRVGLVLGLVLTAWHLVGNPPPRRLLAAAVGLLALVPIAVLVAGLPDDTTLGAWFARNGAANLFAGTGLVLLVVGTLRDVRERAALGDD